MTSVYGVTFIGARKQIQARLEEKLAETDMDPDDIEGAAYGAGHYVARITMDALTELFTGARDIMEWLAECARLVAKEGQPVSWVTPLGLPVIQPYRAMHKATVKTVMQVIQLVDDCDELSVNAQRQRSAFPPNFVHSLDSTHMLLTAMRMQNLGVDFTAVHDSYWTHPSEVDAMNQALRECFVELYSQPILENLHTTLATRFPNVQFPPVPQRGDLDIKTVLDSPYFFC
eukprot:CAMPEP_0182545598 /NCGR_PEP_ID=MMETSP1323-20130603/34750_1 /TAXON_ID=236787 /ORGANISM="Florenciella parvula, Strain RCC1693" /LENGTH=229 /DNA_ID=CAMNT_0024756759 /DNA_START=10 /DNA_END=699 /DNA_ORIENTATION=+